MNTDGNIQYANYQSETQMTVYLTALGQESILAEIILESNYLIIQF